MIRREAVSDEDVRLWREMQELDGPQLAIPEHGQAARFDDDLHITDNHSPEYQSQRNARLPKCPHCHKGFAYVEGHIPNCFRTPTQANRARLAKYYREYRKRKPLKIRAIRQRYWQKKFGTAEALRAYQREHMRRWRARTKRA